MGMHVLPEPYFVVSTVVDISLGELTLQQGEHIF